MGDFAAGIILEQFGVSPLHAAFGEQIFGGFPGAAEAFEQENGFGKFVLHAGDDVLPGGHGNFVAGVAAETVHAAPAPGQKRVGDDVPERDVVLFEFDQIFPDVCPTRRGWRIAIGISQEKFRMIFLQGRTPAGVVDDDVNENARAERMRGGVSSQNWSMPVVRLSNSTSAGSIAVKSSAAYGLPKRPKRAYVVGVGMHGQQMHDAAAERVDDVRQLAREVAEFSRRRNVV
jgi:hypothetical protein